MPTTALTDRTLKTLTTPDSGQTTYWDSNLTGFGVRVSQGGAKSFVVVYGPNRTRKTIGRYPDVSLKQARDKAKELKAAFVLGLDRQRSITWEEARDRFLADSEARNRPATVRYYRSRLNKHFRFGKRQLNDLTRQDFQKRIRGCQTSKGEQHHALVVARTLLNWAVREEYLDVNPLAGLRGLRPPKPRNRVLLDAELREVFLTANAAPYPFGRIVSLLVMTGMRRSEVAHLKWDWIDTDAKTISLPGELTKNGRADAQTRQDRLTDLLIDGTISKPDYELRRKNSIFELAQLDEELKRVRNREKSIDDLRELVNMATDLYILFRAGTPVERRSLLKNSFASIKLHGQVLRTKPVEWLLELKDGLQDPEKLISSEVLAQIGAR